MEGTLLLSTFFHPSSSSPSQSFPSSIKFPFPSSFLPLHFTPANAYLLSIHTSNHQYLCSRFTCSVFSSSSIPGGLPNLKPEDNNLDSDTQAALIRGGEQVTSVLEEMIKLLEDMEMDDASAAIAVEIAAQGVIGKRVDEMESGFIMALDYMIQLAEKDNDDKVIDELFSPAHYTRMLLLFSY